MKNVAKRMEITKMMIRRLASLAGFFLCVFMIRCSQDDGNYVYIDPGTVDFTGMVEEVSGTIGETLFIEGVFSTEASESDLSFMWYYERIGEDGIFIDTLSTERNLNIINDLSNGRSDVFFNVYNKALRVNYRHTINIDNGTPFSEGWAVLKDMGGTTDYDFLSYFDDSLHVQNVLQTFLGAPISGTPVFVDFVSNRQSFDFRSYVTIVSEQDIYTYSSDDLVLRLGGFQNYFENTVNIDLPFTGGSFARRARLSLPGLVTLMAGGKVFTRTVNLNFNSFPVWSGSPLVSDDGYEATHGISLPRLGNFVFYDNLNKRYSYVNNRGNDAININTFLSPADLSIFDPNNLVDYECLWIGSKVTNEARALFRNESGNYFLQGWDITTGQVFVPLFHVTVPDGFLNENSVVVNHTNMENIYFSNGGMIGEFLYNGETPTAASFDNDFITDYVGETVVALATVEDIYAFGGSDLDNILAIGLEGSNGSRVVFYDLGTGVEISSHPIEGTIKELEYFSSAVY